MNDIRFDAKRHHYFIDGRRFRTPSQSEVSTFLFGNKIPENDVTKKAIVTGSNCHVYVQYYLLNGCDPVHEMANIEKEYYSAFKTWWRGSQYWDSWKRGNIESEIKMKWEVDSAPVMCGTVDIKCNINKDIIDLKFGAINEVKHLAQGVAYSEMLPGYKFYNLYINKNLSKPRFIFRDTKTTEAKMIRKGMLSAANVLNLQIQNGIIK